MAKDGEHEIRPPWPSDDINDFRSGLITNMYSQEQLRKRVEAVYASALGIYESLVDQWFSALKNRLLLRATMPVRFMGYLVYGNLSDEPYLQYETFPQQLEDNNVVEITLTTEPQGYSDYEVQLQGKIAALRAARPAAAAWIYPTEGMTTLHVFGATPATTLAYQWISDDLSRIGWLNYTLNLRR